MVFKIGDVKVDLSTMSIVTVFKKQDVCNALLLEGCTIIEEDGSRHEGGFFVPKFVANHNSTDEEVRRINEQLEEIDSTIVQFVYDGKGYLVSRIPDKEEVERIKSLPIHESEAIDYGERLVGVYLKDNVEIDVQQWVEEVFEDYCSLGHSADDAAESIDDICLYGDVYIASSDSVYTHYEYWACDDIRGILNHLELDPEEDVVAMQMVKAAKRLPHDMLHRMFIGFEIKYPCCTTKIVYENKEYRLIDDDYASEDMETYEIF